jgi:glycosyltransferase involved in cell wall biosynthesis
MLWGFCVELGVAIIIVTACTRWELLGRHLEPSLFPDILTGMILVGLFGLPIFLRGRRQARGQGGIIPLHPSVAIIVAAHQEAETIRACIRSLRRGVRRARKDLPLGEVRVVLAVSLDDEATASAALKAGVDKVIPTPPGKLSARHHSIQKAEADIIVAADGDRGYDREWLVRLLKPLLGDPRIVATMGETRDRGGTFSGSALVRSLLKLPFNGGNAAFSRKTYLAVPFNLGLNESRHRELWVEEEFDFGLRLRALGRVAHIPDSYSCELRPYGLFRVMTRHLLGRRLRTF